MSMKFEFKAIGLAAAILLSQVVGAEAANLSGFISGNDTGGGDINAELLAFAGTSDLTQLDKVDQPDTMSGAATVTYLDAEGTTGSWSYAGLVDLVVYKAGNGFVAELFDPGASSGTWDTGLLGLVNQIGMPRAISHVSFYGIGSGTGGGGGGGASPVPLPAPILLLLGGILFTFGTKRLTA